MDLQTQIELIVGEIIGNTRKIKTLEDLGNVNAKGIESITKLVKNNVSLDVVSGSLPTIEQCIDKTDELGDSFVDRDETGDEIWDGFAISKESIIKLVRFAQGNDR